MLNSRLFKRLLYFPLAFVKTLVLQTNEKARDIENRNRYPNANFEAGVTISPDSYIGNHALLCKNVIFNFSAIGQYSYVNINSMIQYATIGNYCSIAHGVKIGLGAHPIDKFSTSPIFYRERNPFHTSLGKTSFSFEENKPIKIGHDVWIGANAIIMDGVTIGNGAIVAAGAIVTKDVPPYAIVGGVPAKTIRFRFKPEKILKLQESKWWTLQPDQITEQLSILDEV